MRSLFLRFEVQSEDDDLSADEIVESLAARCWKWVTDAESVEEGRIPLNWEEGTHELNDTDSLIVRDQRCEGGRFWRMTRDEWGSEEIGQKYVNYIFIAREGERVEFSLLQDIVHQLVRVGPPIEDVRPPAIVREIIGNYKCQFQGEELSGEWDNIPLAKTGDFVEKRILGPSRVLPIVLISKDWETRRPIIEQIGTLSGILAGIARVYILGESNTSQIDSLFGMQKLYNGTIRVFWPGRTRQMLSDPAWDDMYSSRKFGDLYNSDESLLIQALVNKVCNATSSVPASSSLVKSVRGRISIEEREIELEEIEKRRKKALEKLKNSDEKAQYLEGLAEEHSYESGKNKVEISQRDHEIKELQGRITSLKFQLQKISDELTGYKVTRRAVKEAQERNPEGDFGDFLEYLHGYGKPETPEPEPEPEFNNLVEAVEAARVNFSRLRFLDTALESVKKTKSDADPSTVYDIFRWLNDYMWQKIKDDPGNRGRGRKGGNRINMQRVMADYLGDKYAESESGLTMNMYGGQKNHNGRFFPFSKGILIRILPHIKIGTVPLRIHLICLHEESGVEAVESFVRSNGSIGWKKKRAKDVVKSFPSIIIGWCGDHLDTARNKG